MPSLSDLSSQYGRKVAVTNMHASCLLFKNSMRFSLFFLFLNQFSWLLRVTHTVSFKCSMRASWSCSSWGKGFAAAHSIPTGEGEKMIWIEWVEDPGDNEDTCLWRNWSPSGGREGNQPTKGRRRFQWSDDDFTAVPFWGISSVWVDFGLMEMVWGTVPVTAGLITSELLRLFHWEAGKSDFWWTST